MWRYLRIAILLLVLLFVAAGTLVDRLRTTSWDHTLWVGIFPVNGDGRPVTQRYIAALDAAQFASIETFFREAPTIHPNADKITGVICGVRLEEIEDPLMRNIRYLDKLVDELAKGRPMQKILRASDAAAGERPERRGPKTRSPKD